MDAVEWTFECREGLPSETKGRYFGFDGDNAPYILRWVEDDATGYVKAWVATGYDIGGSPVVYVLTEDNANIIIAHAPCPLRWSDLDMENTAPLSKHDASITDSWIGQARAAQWIEEEP